MDMEGVVREIQDTLTVMVELERHQSKMLLDHSERLVNIEEQISDDRRESAKFQRRTDQNLAEITDKLNGLIGYVGNWKRPPQNPTP